MATKKLSEGVGKKIVEALKKQSEIEISPVSAEKEREEQETFDYEDTELKDNLQDDSFLDELSSGDYSEKQSETNEEEVSTEEASNFGGYQPLTGSAQDTFMKDLDSFEIPSNIAVLKKLITQLPSGVTRHTGAQIIKQTMEALGISMKSVLQEAQQVQEGLNNSVKECQTNVQEYKKQIMLLEKQAQNYQRQYMALNELISLFIQTGI